ncbi:MAG: zinc metalloprotease HtpX [Nitrososphaerota archaeon]
MSIWKLRLSILGTLAVIIGLSTLFISVILTLFGVDLLAIGIFVVLFNIAQWLLAPYLIDAMYRVKEATPSEYPELHSMVERLSQKSGIKKPRVMIAKIPVPNAFAYSSSIAGSRVAVTSELLKTLDDEEVEAVLGHELGHLKHRDVQTMMFVSLLPALFYYIGYSMMLSSMFGRSDRKNGGGAALMGVASLAIYSILTMFTLHLSRLREYFADRHSANIVDEGPRKLSEALAKIQYATGRMKRFNKQAGSLSSFKALFIADPDRAETDTVSIAQARGYTSDRSLVEEVLRKKVTLADRLLELFSTHPNIVKRLRALQELT